MPRLLSCGRTIAPGWGFAADWATAKEVRGEDGQELPNSGKKHLHVLAVNSGSRSDPPAPDSVLKCESVDPGLTFRKESAFKILTWALVEVLVVLADEHDGRNPKLLCFMLLEA